MRKFALRVSHCLIVLLFPLGVLAQINPHLVGQTASTSLAIGITPSQNAPIIASDGSNCSDRVDYKNAGGAHPIGTSVEKNYILFPNLTFQWKSTSSYLTVTAITATVTGSVLAGPQIIQISPVEIGYLLNSAANIIPAGLAGTGGTEVDTNDPARNLGGTYSAHTACPFVVGGITLSQTTMPSTFSLQVVIEVDGFSTDAKGNLANVHQSTTATAEYN